MAIGDGLSPTARRGRSREAKEDGDQGGSGQGGSSLRVRRGARPKPERGDFWWNAGAQGVVSKGPGGGRGRVARGRKEILVVGAQKGVCVRGVESRRVGRALGSVNVGVGERRGARWAGGGGAHEDSTPRRETVFTRFFTRVSRCSPRGTIIYISDQPWRLRPAGRPQGRRQRSGFRMRLSQHSSTRISKLHCFRRCHPSKGS